MRKNRRENSSRKGGDKDKGWNEVLGELGGVGFQGPSGEVSLRADACASELRANPIKWGKMEISLEFGTFGGLGMKAGYVLIRVFQTSVVIQPRLEKMHLCWSLSESLSFSLVVGKLDSI